MDDVKIIWTSGHTDWDGKCEHCYKMTEGKPYMSLEDAKLICKSCLDWQLKNKEKVVKKINGKKNPPGKKSPRGDGNKEMYPGMEWEIPEEWETSE